MKKKTLAIIAALSLTVACAGCGNKETEKKNETTTTTTTTTAAAVTEAPETTEAPKTDAPAETSAAAADNSGKTALITFADGSTLYAEDGNTIEEWEDGFIKGYDTGYVRIVKGIYHDSQTEPDLFDTENYEYSGERAELGEVKEVKPGDTFGSLTVSAVELKATSYNSVFSNTVKLDGEITLTGIMSYYFDEQYAISSGDILFTPDASYAGLPAACDPASDTLFIMPRFDTIEIYTDEGIEKKNGDGPACYSDAQQFRLGNLFADYADSGEVNDILNGGNANVTRKVQVTLSDVELTYSEQFGTGHSSAKITSIKAV